MKSSPQIRKCFIHMLFAVATKEDKIKTIHLAIAIFGTNT